MTGSATSTLASISAQRQSEPARLTRLVRGELDWIVMKCLEKDRNRRYESANSLARDVERYLRDEQVQACPPSALYRFRKFARRNKAALATAALVGAVLLAAVVVLAVSAVRIAQEEQAKSRALENEKQALDNERKANEELRNTLYQHGIALAHREWLAHNVGRAEMLLDECPSELRHWEWHYLKRQCHADLRTLHGHRDGVTAVVFSPDGRLLVTGSRDGVVKVWDAQSGQESLSWRAHDGGVVSVAFHPDGKRLATGGLDRTAKIWNVATGQALVTLRHDKMVNTVAFSPDGRYLASGGSGGGVRLSNVTTGAELRTLRAPMRYFGPLAFSPDGQRLASQGSHPVRISVRVLDAASDRELVILPDGPQTVLGVAFSPDGQSLATAQGKTIKLWNALSGAERRTLRGHTDWVRKVAFNRDGRLLTSAGEDQTVKVWDVTSGEEVRTFRGHTDAVTDIAFHPRGDRLASASHDRTVKLWDPTADQEARTFRVNGLAAATPLALISNPPGGRALPQGGPRMCTAWEVKPDQELRVVSGVTKYRAVRFSSDGQRLAVAHLDGPVTVAEAVTGQEVRTLRPPGDEVCHLAFSANGRYLASACRQHIVRVWDLTTGAEGFTLSVPADQRRPDDRRFPRERDPSVALSPDGRYLACSGRGGSVELWDVTTRQKVHEFSGDGGGLAFSPDGRRLAWGGKDRVITLADVTTGQVSTLGGQRSLVLDLAFSPDGRRLASAGFDQTVRLWELAAGQELLTLRGHKVDVYQVAFSTDGLLLGSIDREGTVRVWDGTPAEGSPGEAAP